MIVFLKHNDRTSNVATDLLYDAHVPVQFFVFYVSMYCPFWVYLVVSKWNERFKGMGINTCHYHWLQILNGSYMNISYNSGHKSMITFNLSMTPFVLILPWQVLYRLNFAEMFTVCRVYLIWIFLMYES